MNKICISILFFTCSFLFTNAQNIEGVYNSYISKNLGGYNISQAAELVISKDEKKVLRYKVTNTTIDEYNGSVPKVEMTEGKLKTINNIRYNFLGGTYGKDGAYFQLSKKGLTSSISELTIFFAPGKGSSKFFTK